MGHLIKAGCVYALSVFAIGFVLGTIRVLFVVPRLGATVAVLSEAPFMLAVSWKASKRIVEKFDLYTDADASLLMGAIAFAVLMLAELGVTVLVFSKSVVEHFAVTGPCPEPSDSPPKFALRLFQSCKPAAGERCCAWNL